MSETSSQVSVLSSTQRMCFLIVVPRALPHNKRRYEVTHVMCAVCCAHACGNASGGRAGSRARMHAGGLYFGRWRRPLHPVARPSGRFKDIVTVARLGRMNPLGLFGG